MSAENNVAHPFSVTELDALQTLPQRGWEAETNTHVRPAKIALFGLFGCGNLGNDGSLEAMLEFLRRTRPDAELLCICDNPAWVAQTYGVMTVPISWSRHVKGLFRKFDRLCFKIPGKLADLAQTLRYVRGIDAIVIPGTGILDDFGERPYGMPFDIFRWCIAARTAGARIAMISIGAGPIGHRLSRWLMTAAARLAHYRSYRDTLSKEFMESVGFDTSQDFVYPDIVFKLKAPAAPQPKSEGSTCLVVGVGVMSYYGWYGFADGGEATFDRYIEKMARFVVHLLDSGHDVRLLTGEITDQTAVDALLARVAGSRPNVPAGKIIAEPSHSLHDLMRQISAVDVVVATRFHNVVCALKLGKPIISLGYSKKNDVLMAEMGLGAYCQHVERFDVETLVDQFNCLVVLRENYEQRIRQQNRRFKEQLEQQDAFLLSTMI